MLEPLACTRGHRAHRFRRNLEGRPRPRGRLVEKKNDALAPQQGPRLLRIHAPRELQNFQDFRGIQLLNAEQRPARHLVHPVPEKQPLFRPLASDKRPTAASTKRTVHHTRRRAQAARSARRCKFLTIAVPPPDVASLRRSSPVLSKLRAPNGRFLRPWDARCPR